MIIFSLRIPKELHARLRDIAQQEKRSINAEILWIIEEYIKKKEKQG